MGNLIQYRHSFETLFFKYLKGQIDLDTLSAEMVSIKVRHRVANRHEGTKFVFKFSKDDTGSTTISELINDLKSPTNRQYRLEQMQACIDLNAGINGTELYIYFS